MTAQDDFVKDQLDILQQMQIDGMDYEDYLRWQSKINDVKNGYDEARGSRGTRSGALRSAAGQPAQAVAGSGRPAAPDHAVSAALGRAGGGPSGTRRPEDRRWIRFAASKSC